MVSATSFANHLLIAMPTLMDSNFEKAVVYICEDGVQGTVGLIINHPMEYPLSIVFDQLHIEHPNNIANDVPLLYGGPIQPERGFVLHRPLGEWHSSLSLRDDVTVTTSNDIIRAIAENQGPKDALILLGYAGWEEKQLEKEIMDNIWLVCPFKPEILYDVPYDKRWLSAGLTIGVKMDQISEETGHA